MPKTGDYVTLTQNMVTINVKNIDGKATLPVRGSAVAAGYDVVAVDDPVVVGEVAREDEIGGQKIIMYRSIDYLEYHTSLAISPQAVMHTLIHPRSSVRKYNLVLANSIGLVDEDYRGELLISFKYIWQPEDLLMESVNMKAEGETDDQWTFTGKIIGGINWTKVYRKGDKIGQLVGEGTNPLNFVFVSELDTTARGTGGHGSTDTPKPQQPFDAEHTAGKTLSQLYQEAGGVPTKKRYIDQVKEREGQLAAPVTSGKVYPTRTGIQER